MRIKRMKILLATILGFVPAVVQAQSAAKYDAATIMDCASRFVRRGGSHRCNHVTSQGGCLDGVAAIKGYGPVAGKGNVEGVYLYSRAGAYFLPVPERPAKQFDELVERCIKDGNGKHYCEDLKLANRYLEVEMPMPGEKKQKVILEYGSRGVEVATFERSFADKWHYKDTQKVIVEDKLGDPIDSWPGPSRELLVSEIEYGIEVTGIEAAPIDYGVSSQAGEVKLGRGPANPYSNDLALMRRCRNLSVAGSPGRKKVDKAIKTLEKLNQNVEQSLAEEAREKAKAKAQAGKKKAY